MTESFTDISDLKSSINNLLITGDTIFTTMSPADILGDVQKRNKELTAKIDKLKKNRERMNAIISKNNRDFIDNEGKTNVSTLLSVEDYTVFVFVLSYLFLACMAVYTYTYQSAIPEQGLMKSVICAIIFTIVGGFIFYSVA